MRWLFEDSVLSVPQLIPFTLVLMLFATVVTRSIVAIAGRLCAGHWVGRFDVIVFTHILTLLCFATVFTLGVASAEAYAPFSGFGEALLRSIEMFWPIQVIFLVLDLAIRLCAVTWRVKRFG